MTISLFLFAHQDDEFGVFQKIIEEISKGRKIYCVYFTTGVSIGKSSFNRNNESISVLTRLGVVQENILFAGEELQIPDGSLIENLSKAKNWLKNWFCTFILRSEGVSIYLPAWEGGHPDHDLLHSIGVLSAHELNILNCVWQFPLYNSYKCFGKFFRILYPLPNNGQVSYTKIQMFNRYMFLRQIFSYPSQIKTWLGIFPFMLIHYIFIGTQSVQSVSLSRIFERPHIGSLYYEKRKFATWVSISKRIYEIL